MYSEAITVLPDHPDIVWLYGGIVKCQIKQENFTQVQTVLDQLWSPYSSAPTFVECLNSVKEAYWYAGKYAAYFSLCDRIVTELPDDPMSPGILRDEIKGHINRKDLTAADGKLEILWSTYSSADGFVGMLNSVRAAYWRTREYATHNVLCDRILTEFPGHQLFPSIATNEIQGCILLGDMTTANAKLESLWTEYSSTDQFVTLLNSVRQAYWNAGQYAIHNVLCDRVLTEFPDHAFAPKFIAGETNGHIKLGNITAATARLEMLWTKQGATDEFVELLNSVRTAYWSADQVDKHNALCERILTEFPDHKLSPAILTKEILGYIKLRDMATADTKLDILWTKYSSTSKFADLLYSVKTAYWYACKYEAHHALCDRIVAEFPDDPLAPIVLRDEIRGYVNLKDMVNADAKLEVLWTNYNSINGFVAFLNPIRKDYWDAGQYASHNILCDRILTEFPDHRLSFEILTNDILGYIKLNDMPIADARLEMLWEKYASTNGLMKSVNTIKEEYWDAGEYAAYLSLCDRIVAEFPYNLLTPTILRDKIKAYVSLNDMVNADVCLETLWTKYSSSDRFVRLLNSIKEIYWYAGQHDAYFSLCDRIVTELPDDPMTPKILRDQIKGYVNLKDMDNVNVSLEALWTKYGSADGFVGFLNSVKEAYWLAGNHSEYFALCDRIATEFPNDLLTPKVLRDEIKAYVVLKDMANANARLETLWANCSSAEGFVEVLNHIKGVFQQAGQYDAYHALCDRIAADFPDDPLTPTILREEIQGFIKNQDMTLAELKAEVLFAKYNNSPEYVDMVLSICNSFIRQNDPAMALPFINRALLASPDHEKAVQLLKTKADCYASMGAGDQVDTVIDEIVQNHSTKKEYLHILSGIAESFRKYGDHERSIELHQMVLDNNPEITEQLTAQMNVAKNYVAAGDDAKVDEQLGYICANFPNNRKLPYTVYVIGEEYYFIGQKLRAEKRHAEAAIQYQKAIDIWKQRILDTMPGCDHEAEAYLFSGISHMRLKQYSPGAECFKKVIQDWPDYHYLGAAFSWYETCLRVMPGKKLITVEEATQSAEDVFNGFIEKKPGGPYAKMALRRLGDFYFHKSRIDDAIDCYERLLDDDINQLIYLHVKYCKSLEMIGSDETAEEVRGVLLEIQEQ